MGGVMGGHCPPNFLDRRTPNKNVLLAKMGILQNVLKSEQVNLQEIPLQDLVNMLKRVVGLFEEQADVYPNYNILFKICLTLPLKSATCERSFSAMCRINNWLRCSMSQDRFSNYNTSVF